MSAQNLINILGDDTLKATLLEQIEKQHVLNQSQEVFKQEKAAIAEVIKMLGLKPAEFTKIVKYSKDEGDLLMNELAFLENIQDSLVSEI